MKRIILIKWFMDYYKIGREYGLCRIEAIKTALKMTSGDIKYKKWID